MAVVRVKRRCDEEPSDILVLACKIRKTENAESETSVFKLAATVNNQEDKSLYCTHPFKADAEATIKSKCRKVQEVTKKLREEHQTLSKRNRYKVVNLYRSLNESDIKGEINDVSSRETEQGRLTVLDVESNNDLKTADEASTDDGEPTSKYVYDLYYAADGVDFNDLQLEQIDSVHGLGSDFMHEHRGGTESDSDTNMADDDDDSNDENNWRNDYPDEEEDYFNDGDSNIFEDEDDDVDNLALVSRMRSFKLLDDDDEVEEGEDDLSSDEDILYNDKLDTRDISQFGTSYARYKARVNREEYDSSCSVDSE